MSRTEALTQRVTMDEEVEQLQSRVAELEAAVFAVVEMADSCPPIELISRLGEVVGVCREALKGSS